MSEAHSHDPYDEDDEAFLASIEAARKSLDEGRGIDLEDVAPWLLSWGKDNELPPPECG